MIHTCIGNLKKGIRKAKFKKKFENCQKYDI